jgi:leucyl-tRNA synthetase
MTLAPEHELVAKLLPRTESSCWSLRWKNAKRSERERMADVKTISGVLQSLCWASFTKEPVPVWIGIMFLAGYGTGAVMAVPCGDERDYALLTL